MGCSLLVSPTTATGFPRYGSFGEFANTDSQDSSSQGGQSRFRSYLGARGGSRDRHQRRPQELPLRDIAPVGASQVCVRLRRHRCRGPRHTARRNTIARTATTLATAFCASGSFSFHPLAPTAAVSLPVGSHASPRPAQTEGIPAPTRWLHRSHRRHHRTAFAGSVWRQ
jgi:hypothetical protein